LIFLSNRRENGILSLTVTELGGEVTVQREEFELEMY
jgi:hypothetical protein